MAEPTGFDDIPIPGDTSDPTGFDDIQGPEINPFAKIDAELEGWKESQGKSPATTSLLTSLAYDHMAALVSPVYAARMLSNDVIGKIKEFETAQKVIGDRFDNEGAFAVVQDAFDLADMIGSHTVGRLIRATMQEDRFRDLPPATGLEGIDISKIVEALGPDIDYLLDESGLNAAASFKEVDYNPSGRFRANAITRPYKRVVLDPGRDFTPAAKFGLGFSLELANPANWLADYALAKGMTSLATTRAGQRFLDDLVSVLPDSLQKGLEIGKFKLPGALRQILFERDRDIANLLREGKAIEEKLITLTPGERRRVMQLRQGGISIAGGEKAGRIRTYAKEMGDYIDKLSKNLIDAGVPDDALAAVIRENLGTYMPRLYRSIEGPIKGRSPNNLLNILWDLEQPQIDSLSRLSPRAAEKVVDFLNSLRKPPAHDASKFGSLTLGKAKPRLMSRASTRETAKRIDDIVEQQKAIRKEAAALSVDDISGMDFIAKGKLRRKGWGIDRIAQVFSDAEKNLPWIDESNFQQLLRVHPELEEFIKAAGKKPSLASVRWAEKMSDAAKGVIGKRNELIGKWGNLEGMKGSVSGKVAKEGENYRLVMGEIKDPVAPFSKAASQLVTEAETAKTLSRIAEFSDWVKPADYRPALEAADFGKFVKVPDNKKFGALAGRYVRQDVANRVVETVELMTRTPSAIRKSMQAWKFGKVVLNPAAHVRNWMNNVMLMDIVGEVDLLKQPKLWRDAIQELSTDGKWAQMAKKHGAIGNDFLQAELNEIAKVATQSGDDLNMIEQAFEMGKIAANKAGTIYQTEEQLGKLAKFIHDVRDMGVNPRVAAKRAQEALFNYNDVPSLIRKIREHPAGIPFITYPYKALPAVAKAMAKDPMRVVKYDLLFRAIDNGTAASLGMNHSEWRAFKRLASKDDALFTRFVGLPFVDDNGNPHLWDLTYTLPWGDLGETGQIPFVPQGFTPGAITTPMVQLIFNRNFWGGEVYNKNTSGRQIAEDIGDHLVKSYMPTLFPNGYAFERLQKSVRGLRQRGTELPQPFSSAFTDTFLGIKARPTNEEINADQKLMVLKNAQRTLDGMMIRASISLGKGFIREEEFDQALEDYKNNVAMLHDKIREVADDLKKVRRAKKRRRQ